MAPEGFEDLAPPPGEDVAHFNLAFNLVIPTGRPVIQSRSDRRLKRRRVRARDDTLTHYYIDYVCVFIYLLLNVCINRLTWECRYC